jgi:ABC-type Zn2+ transport system substrate-binding protein/surface adhesin
VRPTSTAERVHRHRAEAVDDPALEVLGQADSGLRCAEGHGLHEDAGQQEVDVLHPLRERPLHRAAEHVGEQQHEHDRLDGREDQQLWLANEMAQVAAGDHACVGDCRAQAR